ncbi:MAG: ABC transporter ATP-binding protein [Anaerolineae bacterium]
MAVRNLVKKYPDVKAVDGISFDTYHGEVFGLVGPNGAGKTTLIEMIEGLRTPDSGSITVLGLDPVRDANSVKECIGVQLQTTSIQPNITVIEAIKLFASLYRRPLANPEQLLTALSLEEKAGSRFSKLSGGQKQRVAIALALVNDPELVFLDEVSTGLDPQARRNMWALVEQIRDQGKTVFLTTHYMEEAETLCDRVGIIDHGRLIALDTPRNLVSSLGADSKVLFTVDDRDVPVSAFETFPEVSRAEKLENGYVLYTKDDSATLGKLVRLSDNLGFRLANIRTEVPNMDDVFLTLTGRELRE